MKSTEMLDKIKTLLNIEVKLEEMKLENGTVVEAESFEKGKDIFIITDDEKVALPVGEYILEDSRLIVVEEEGKIADVRNVSDEVPQKEKNMDKEITEDLDYKDEEMRDDGKEAAVNDWEGMEKRIKNLEDAIADLKSKMGEKDVKVSEEDKEELKQEVKEEINQQLKEELSQPASAPIKHTPEVGNKQKQNFRISPNRRPSTMDYILNQLNK